MPIASSESCARSWRSLIGGDVTPSEIRDARKSLALTQGQLAAVMGLRPATISDWERGVYIQDSSNERLLRAYLDGYRPADWPVKPMEGC